MTTKEAHLLNQPTRREILIKLKKQGTLSIQEMAAQVGITEMGIRRHLYALQKDKYVRTTICRQPLGRPAYLYSLTDKAAELFVSSYDALATELIDEMTDMAGSSFVLRLFERRRVKLLQKYTRLVEGLGLEERAAVLAQMQNDEGYMAELRKDADGNYWLEEANCPIARVAARYQQACQCELSLFSEVLQTRVERVECMAEGGKKCLYRIEKNKK